MIPTNCTECDWTGPERGFYPHRGRMHPDINHLQNYIKVRLRDMSEDRLDKLVDFIQDLDND